MTTIIMRNSFIFKLRGVESPPDVAYYIDGRPVTWAEVMEKRRERQRLILDRKRANYEGVWRPVRVTVRYFDMSLMGGWHTYLDAAGGYSHWLRYEDHIKRELMTLFPVRNPRSPLFPVTNWHDWQQAFAETYPKGEFCKRPRGFVVIWARMSGSGHWASANGLALAKPTDEKEAGGYIGKKQRARIDRRLARVAEVRTTGTTRGGAYEVGRISAGIREAV